MRHEAVAAQHEAYVRELHGAKSHLEAALRAAQLTTHTHRENHARAQQGLRQSEEMVEALGREIHRENTCSTIWRVGMKACSSAGRRGQREGGRCAGRAGGARRERGGRGICGERAAPLQHATPPTGTAAPPSPQAHSERVKVIEEEYNQALREAGIHGGVDGAIATDRAQLLLAELSRMKKVEKHAGDTVACTRTLTHTHTHTFSHTHTLSHTRARCR